MLQLYLSFFPFHITHLLLIYIEVTHPFAVCRMWYWTALRFFLVGVSSVVLRFVFRMFTLPLITVICNASLCLASPSFFRLVLVVFVMVPGAPTIRDITFPVVHSAWLSQADQLIVLLFLPFRSLVWGTLLTSCRDTLLLWVWNGCLWLWLCMVVITLFHIAMPFLPISCRCHLSFSVLSLSSLRRSRVF